MLNLAFRDLRVFRILPLQFELSIVNYSLISFVMKYGMKHLCICPVYSNQNLQSNNQPGML